MDEGVNRPTIPWLRIFGEGIVIVVSILLAFGIEAWWQGRHERSDERQVLESLQQDFQENRVLLASKFPLDFNLLLRDQYFEGPSTNGGKTQPTHFAV